MRRTARDSIGQIYKIELGENLQTLEKTHNKRIIKVIKEVREDGGVQTGFTTVLRVSRNAHVTRERESCEEHGAETRPACSYTLFIG